MRRTVSKRVRVPLDHPVEVDGVLYTELRVRRAKPKDLWAMNPLGTKLENGVAMFARLCGVSEAVFDALSDEDGERVGNVVISLLGRVA
jgi:Phage tail assembly chaperone proteins, E, or 41 or 14